MNTVKDTEQLDILLQTAMMLLEKQSNQNQQHISQTQKEFISLLENMKQELMECSCTQVKNELDTVLKGYASDMEAVREKMLEQTKEFNSYLHIINIKNKQLVFRSWLAVSLSLVLLLIGGAGIAYYYSQLVNKHKTEAELAELIGKSDLIRCGDSLCAKTGKTQQNGYRAVLKR